MIRKLRFEEAHALLTGDQKPVLLDVREEPEYLNLLRDPMYTVVYEKHGWRNVRDFFAEFSDLEDGAEYMCLCSLEPAKAGNWAFPNVLLSLLLEKNQGKKRSLGCDVADSDDGQNHFWLLRKKTAP